MRVLLVLCVLTGSVFAQSSRDRLLLNQHEEARRVCDVWLKLLDGEKFDQAWDQTAVFFKSKIDRKAWDELARQIVQQHRDNGGMGERVEVRSQASLNPPAGFPEGPYWAFYYRTKYADGSRIYETVIAQIDENGHYEITGYYRRDY
jgi:hypothetical protein